MKRPVRSCLWNADISSSAVSRKTLALLEPETAGLSPRVHLRALARHVTFHKLSLSLFMTRTGYKLPSYCHLLFLPTPRKPPASTAMLSTPLGPQCMQHLPPPHTAGRTILSSHKTWGAASPSSSSLRLKTLEGLPRGSRSSLCLCVCVKYVLT